MKGILILFIAFSSLTFAQNELVNIYLSYSAVYGGMEDGGVSSSQRHVFVANKNIIMPYLKVNDQIVELQKGDSLVVVWSDFQPYNAPPDSVEDDVLVFPIKEFFIPQQQRKHMYYLGINRWEDWSKAITYRYKGKEFIAKIKSEYDVNQTHYAP